MPEKTNKKTARAPAVRMTMAQRLSNYICPLLLGGTLCFSVVYSLYRPAAPFCTAGFLAAEFLLFCLFDRLKRRTLLGGLLYTLMCLFIELGAGYLLVVGAYNNNSYTSPVTWFYGDEGNYSSQPYYLGAVMADSL